MSRRLVRRSASLGGTSSIGSLKGEACCSKNAGRARGGALWQVRGFCARGAPLHYVDDDALQEGYAEEDVSEEAAIYPSRVIDNDKDADLIKGV